MSVGFLKSFSTRGGDTDEDTKNELLVSDIEQNSETSSEIPLDHGDRRIGYVTAVFLVTNRILGTGIFSTSSTIYNLSGSVGLSLILWVVGLLIAMSGLIVYSSYGSYPSRYLQRNGGEKNYLEYVYSKPRFLVTCMYAVYILLLGWAAPNSVVFGQYILEAAEVEVTTWNARAIGIGCVTFAFLINAVNVKLGIYLQNALAIFKIAIVLVITITGWVALSGNLSSNLYKPTHAFSNAFDGKKPSGYGVVTALYNIIWSFIGYSNVNYSLGEVKNPVKTLRYSAPLALIFLSIIYIFVNISYFAVVPKETIATSGQILLANFFKIAFGPGKLEKLCSVFVALSALGNVLSVIFSQGRVVQQLGREGILPFSSFFASQKPFNSPFVGLFEHWVICIITIVAPPLGDAYNFVLNLISYPLNIINFFVAIGLLWLHLRAKQGKREWTPVIKSPIIVTIFFALSSLYLIVAPYIPPDEGQSVYNSMPYWTHCVATWGIFAIGVIYYFTWTYLLPKIFKYQIISKDVLEEDGFWRNVFIKVPNDVVDVDLFVELKLK